MTSQSSKTTGSNHFNTRYGEKICTFVRMLISLGRGPKSDPFLANDFYIVLILVWKAEQIEHCSVCFGDKSYLFVKPSN